MNWLLLIATIPGRAGSLRLRFWRLLKGIGAANLRDGVYLLPLQEGLRSTLTALCDELIAAGGNVWLIEVPGQSPDVETVWRTMFDRSDAYLEWGHVLGTFAESLAAASEMEARRQVRQLRKDLDAIAGTDFFPGESLDAARRALADTEKRLTRQFAPDEPEAAPGRVALLDRSDYRGRLWATRARPWVDRVASAWLIRRFIDPHARFIWLKDIKDCPADALGFDYDGAAFTHVGKLVTFETLLASFGLDTDPALARLGGLVHALDVGGLPVAEAAGVETLLAGLRASEPDDNRLLDRACDLLDWLLQSYKEDTP